MNATVAGQPDGTAGMADVPNIALSDGHSIPQLGLGTYQLEPDQTQRVVEAALDMGYRHLDTAAIYGNEAEVGRALAVGALPRDSVYVTTKLANDDQEHPRDAFMRSLERLDLEYVDLYLVHWPCPGKGIYVEVWRELQKLKEQHLVRSLGVSNFLSEHLRALDAADLPQPTVNQIEISPWLQQREEVGACRSRRIAVEGWSPLGRLQHDLSRVPAVAGKTPAQVILRWHIQKGYIVFPKSSRSSRVRENLNIFDFELCSEQMAALDSLESGKRVGPDPKTYC